ncbi:Rha family transcriptional regulator [Acetobacter sp. P5B1]|uniref:Rha family transcriptional regulator n=1 Tax=Acetobacter sp. P5B1 TaxID=2762620 RepID=UPI001C04411C|nr:Rha family transcriptional regulator [Acetobacter sp. P5B1]
MIRKLIKRYLPELDKLGPRSTVERVVNGGNATEYYLNRKQAIFITAKSETAEATDITIEIIERFDAYERGEARPEIAKPKRIRKPSFAVTFDRCMRVVSHLPNVDENQKVLMAARGTHNLCGINPLEVMGYTALPAQTEDNYKTPTELGKELGLSGRRVNQILSEEKHLQVHTPGSASGSDWSMTEKGLPYGKMFDTTRKGGKGSQQQLKWKPSVIEFLRPFAKTSA